MFGAILKGGAWCATGALTTIGALTFVPDDAWKSFPDALAPVRTALAQIGVAPPQYSPNGDGADAGDLARSGEISENWDESGEFDGLNGGETSASARTSVRIGRRNGPLGGRFLAENGAGLDVESVARNGAVPKNPELSVNSGADVQKLVADYDGFDGFDDDKNATNAGNAADAALGNNAEAERNVETAQNVAIAEEENNNGKVGGVAQVSGIERNGFSAVSMSAPTENAENWANWEDGAALAQGGATPAANESASGASGEYPDSDEIPVFDLTNLTETPESSPVAGVANASNEAVLPEISANSANSHTETTTPSAPESRSQTDGFDFAAELENALKEAETLEAARQNGENSANGKDFAGRTKDVFLTLNRIRRERGAALAPETTARLNGALDRLAFDVFYNPRTAILEPPYVVASGDALATVGAKFAITPETVGAINGLDVAPDAPLSVGSTLKTVRGPVALELSASKKEALLTFNGLYAGRFAFGLPETAATLRGKFVVSGKIVNPPCNAVDAAGNPISIPGGAPENPLGAAWIALVAEDGSAAPGLQGTNRPELVGTLVSDSENGGIIFSDREVAQLNVLLPIGAEVVFVD